MTSLTSQEWMEMIDANLALLFTEKNAEQWTSPIANHAIANGTIAKHDTTWVKDTVLPVSKKTRLTVTTVVTSAGVVTTTTVLMKVTTTATEKTHLSTVTPTDLALLSLEKESII
jgi:hypothetical protein